GFYWIYAPMQFPDYSIVVITQEDDEGERIVEEAVKVWPAETGRHLESLGRPDVALEFRSGTRDPKAATITFSPRGDSLPPVRVEPAVPAHLAAGTGYGSEPDWRHGMYQGAAPHTEGVLLDLDNPEDRKRLFGITDHLSRFECDGQVGWGLFE